MSYPIWTWSPDWASGVRERISWLTAIDTARDGTEYRRRMRADTRTSIAFDTLVIGEEQRRLSMMLQAHQAEEWLMPVWWDVSFLTGSTELAITFDASNRDFARPGAFSHAVLCHSITGEYLAIEIAYDTIGGFWLLKDPIDPAKWPIGTRIYPARIVQLPASQMLSHITAGVTSLSVEARVVDNQNWPAASTPEYLELLEPNRIRPISAGLERQVGVADFSVGKSSVSDFGGRSFRSATYDYLCATRAELADIRRALSRLAGRLGELRLPTFQADLTNKSSYWIQDGEIASVTPREFFSVWESVDGIMTKVLGDGRAYISGIDDVYDGVDSVFIGLTYSDLPSWDAFIQPGGAKYSLVYNSRLASDTVEILHHTAEVSEVAINYRSIK